MKLPSYLAKSRHGVFYYRITVRRGAAIQEKRWSLNTRSPAEAKLKALYISAAIKGVTMSSGDGRQKFDVFDQRTWPSDAELEIDAAKGDAVAQALLEIKRKRLADGVVKAGFDLSEMSDSLRALQISIGNVTLTADPNNPADLKAARDMALSMMTSDGGGQRSAGPASADKSAAETAPPVSGNPGWHVVTNEVSAPDSKKDVKLPDAAQALGVQTFPLGRILRLHARNNFTFVADGAAP